MKLEDYKIDQIIPDIIEKLKDTLVIYDFAFSIPYLVNNIIYKITIKIEKE